MRAASFKRLLGGTSAMSCLSASVVHDDRGQGNSRDGVDRHDHKRASILRAKDAVTKDRPPLRAERAVYQRITRLPQLDLVNSRDARHWSPNSVEGRCKFSNQLPTIRTNAANDAVHLRPT